MPRVLIAPRVAYFLATGKDPYPFDVLHRCDNPPCVNDGHFFLGTKGDNNRDRKAKGRSAFGDRNGKRTRPDLILSGADHPLVKNPELAVRGSEHGCAIIDEAKALEIKRAFRKGYGAAPRTAAELGVSVHIVKDIWRGKTWRQIVAP